MNRLLALAMVLILALTLMAACTSKDDNPSGEGNNGTTAKSNDNTPDETEPNGGGNDKPNSGSSLINKGSIMMTDEQFSLPDNVWFEFTMSVNGKVSSTTTIVKIGNDLYEKGSLGETMSTEEFNKYNGKDWQVWNKVNVGSGGADWDSSGTCTADELINSMGDTKFSFMTSSWYYTDKNKNSKSGTESIAGVTCDVYKYTDTAGESTIYYDPISNLFFKCDHTKSSGSTLYEVVKWDTSIKSFADAGITNLPE